MTMLASCLSSWDDFSLMFNRVTILAVCAWGVSFCSARAFSRGGDVSMVSRALWLVPTATMAALFMLVLGFTVSCQDALSTWERTVYGGLLVWTIAGLMAVIVYGHGQVERAVEKAESYRVELEQALRDLTDEGADE